MAARSGDYSDQMINNKVEVNRIPFHNKKIMHCLMYLICKNKTNNNMIINSSTTKQSNTVKFMQSLNFELYNSGTQGRHWGGGCHCGVLDWMSGYWRTCVSAWTNILCVVAVQELHPKPYFPLQQGLCMH